MLAIILGSTSMFRWVVLFGVWAAYSAFGLVATSLAPLVPLVEQDLQLSHTAMGSIMGAWQLTYIVAAIPCGLLLDRYPARYTLTLGILLIALSALLRGFATDYTSLLFAVMLFGLGGPIISTGAPKIITGWFEGSSRGLAMGVYMTGPAIGGVVSLTLTHTVLLPWLGDWQTLMIVLSVVVSAVALLWLLIANHSLLLASESRAKASNSPTSERPTRFLLSQRTVQIVLLMSVGVFLFNHGLNNWLPELLKGHGMTLIEAGYWAAIPTVIGILGSLTIPRLATPGRRFKILLALCICAFGSSVLLQFEQQGILTVGLIIQGIARSSLMTVLVLTLVELPGIGERYAGLASGLFFTAAEFGGVMGPTMLGITYDYSGDFTLGLGLLSVTAALLTWATLVLMGRVKQTEATSGSPS